MNKPQNLQESVNRMKSLMGMNESLGDLVTGVATDLPADALADLISAVPGVGDAAAASFVIKNLVEIHEGTEELEKLLQQNADIGEISKQQGVLVGDLIDLIQRSLGVLPDPGASEAVSFVTSIADNIVKIVNYASHLNNIDTGRKYIIKVLEIMKNFQDKITSFAGELKLPNDLNPGYVIDRSIDVLSRSQEHIDNIVDGNQSTIDAIKQIQDL